MQSKIRNITAKSFSIFVAIILISSVAIPIFGYAKPVLAQTAGGTVYVTAQCCGGSVTIQSSGINGGQQVVVSAGGEAGPYNVPSGTSVTVTANPTTGNIFTIWSGSINGVTCPMSNGFATCSSGNPYTFTVSSGTTSITGSFKASQLPLGVSITPGFATVNPGQSVSFTANPTGGSGGYTYTWYWTQFNTANQGNYNSGSSNNYQFTPSNSGSYGVYVIARDNSGNTAQSLESTVTVSNTQTPGSIQVLVYDQITGKPIQGSSVSMTSAPSGQNLLSGTTDSSGQFTFQSAISGSYQFRASAQGYLTNTGSGNVQNSQTSEVTILLQSQSGSTGGNPGTCSTANSATVDNSNISGAQSLTINSGSCQYFFVGSTAGGSPMNTISWDSDLDVIASYSNNLAISIGHQTGNTGSYVSSAGNYGIAGVGMSGFGSYSVFTASTPNSDTLSKTFTTNSNDLVLILVGGEGDGSLSLSGISSQTLVDQTYSEAGSNVIASEAIYEAQLPAGTYTININSVTYPSNSGTSLGLVIYDFHGNTVSVPNYTFTNVTSRLEQTSDLGPCCWVSEAATGSNLGFLTVGGNGFSLLSLFPPSTTPNISGSGFLTGAAWNGSNYLLVGQHYSPQAGALMYTYDPTTNQVTDLSNLFGNILTAGGSTLQETFWSNTNNLYYIFGERYLASNSLEFTPMLYSYNPTTNSLINMTTQLPSAFQLLGGQCCAETQQMVLTPSGLFFLFQTPTGFKFGNLNSGSFSDLSSTLPKELSIIPDGNGAVVGSSGYRMTWVGSELFIGGQSSTGLVLIGYNPSTNQVTDYSSYLSSFTSITLAGVTNYNGNVLLSGFKGSSVYTPFLVSLNPSTSVVSDFSGLIPSSFGPVATAASDGNVIFISGGTFANVKYGVLSSSPFTLPTQDITTTSLSFSSTSVNTGSQTTVTATVTDVTANDNPEGTVTFSDGNPSAGGTFGSVSCNPSSKNLFVCTATYTAPHTPGSVTIYANYVPSNTSFGASSNSAALTVTPAVSHAVMLFPPCNNDDATSVVINGNATDGASVKSISWNWGDGQNSTGNFPQMHIYSSDGTFDITVMVSYNDGSITSAKTTASVPSSHFGNDMAGCNTMTIDAGYLLGSTTGEGGSVTYSAVSTSGTVPAGQSKIIFIAQGEPVHLQANPLGGSTFSRWETTDPIANTINSQPPNLTQPGITDSDSGNRCIAASFSPMGEFQITTLCLPEGNLRESYYAPLNATGGNPSYTWSDPDNNLSGVGLSISPSGVISGKPTNFGPVWFRALATDSSGYNVTKILYFYISEGVSIQCPNSSCSFEDDQPLNMPYSIQLNAIGGVSPYDFSLTSTCCYPSGTTVSPSGAVTMPTPQPGVYTFVVQVNDAKGGYSTQNILLTIPPVITGLSPKYMVPTTGGTIIINGKGLFGVTEVQLGSQSIHCTSTSCIPSSDGQQLTVVVPSSTQTGIENVSVLVNTNGVQQASGVPFSCNDVVKGALSCNQIVYIPSTVPTTCANSDDTIPLGSIDASATIENDAVSVSYNGLQVSYPTDSNGNKLPFGENYEKIDDTPPNPTTTQVTIAAEGTTTLNMQQQFCISAQQYQINNLDYTVTLNPNLNLNLDLQASGQYSKTINLSPPIKTTPLVAGPVIVVPQLTPVLIVSGSGATDVKMNLASSPSDTFDLTYNPQQGIQSTNSGITCENTGGKTEFLCIVPTSTSSFNGEGKVAMGVVIDLLIYDVAGVEVTPNVYAQLDGGISSGNSDGNGVVCQNVPEGESSGTWYALCGGVDVDAGVGIKPFGYSFCAACSLSHEFSVGNALLASSVGIRPSYADLSGGQSQTFDVVVAGTDLESPNSSSAPINFPVIWSLTNNSCGNPTTATGDSYTYNAPNTLNYCENQLDATIQTILSNSASDIITVNYASTDAVTQTIPITLGYGASNMSPTTGVSVTISDSNTLSGTADVTSTVLTSPSTTTSTILVGSQYYDVKISGITDGISTITILDPTASQYTQMQYWTGSSWANANNISFIAGQQISGDIPVSALGGTNIAIGDRPFGEKNYVISNLNSLTPETNDDKNDIKEAINQVTQSIDSSLWNTDGIHLDTKKGDQVFDHEKQAVQQLEDIVKGNKENTDFNNLVRTYISTLSNVDKTLATTSIDDANATASELSGEHTKDAQNDIVQAQKEMNQASGETLKGHFDAAIDHYKNAWKHAEDAIQDLQHH